jgi:hypothetical protein
MDLHLPSWARRAQPESVDIPSFFAYLGTDGVDVARLDTGGKEIPLLLISLALARETPLERRVAAAERMGNVIVDPEYGLPWFYAVRTVITRLEGEEVNAVKNVLRLLRQRAFDLAFATGLIVETRAARAAMGPAALPDATVKSFARYAATSGAVQLAMEFVAENPRSAATDDALTNLKTKLREVSAHATV